MLIFDVIDRGVGKPGYRVTVLGTCRVRDPFLAMAKSGDAILCGITPFATFTPFEAAQLIRLVDGADVMDENLRPMALDSADISPLTPALRRSRSQSDAYVVEISELRRIGCGDHVFQTNYFYRHFVQPRGRAMMPWYRELTINGEISSKIAGSTLDALKASDGGAPPWLEKVVRHTRIRRVGVEELAAGMRELTALAPRAQWLFAPRFLAPGEVGTRRDEAQALVDAVGRAASMVGQPSFDPSALVESAGRKTALAEDGGDIYHYAPAFLPTAGATYLGVLDGLSQTRRPNAPSARPDIPDVLPRKNNRRAALAAWLNGFLVAEVARRKNALGVTEGGLFAHYDLLLSRGAVLHRSVIMAADVICLNLPHFDRIVVAGANLGEAAFLLALAGRAVDAFEFAPLRRAAMLDLRARLVEISDEGLDRRLTCHETPLPRRTDSRGSCLFVAIDFVGSKPADYEAILDAIRACDGALISLRSFLKLRTPDEEVEANDMIERLGFERRRDFPSYNFVYYERVAEPCDA